MAVLFLLETAAWAAPVSLHEVLQNPAQDSVRIQALINTIRIPAELGSIQKQFIAPAPGSVALIHIEDAHGEPKAQKNTQAILEHLKKEYGIQTFFLEGAWSKLDAGRLKCSTSDERFTPGSVNKGPRCMGSSARISSFTHSGFSRASRGASRARLFRHQVSASCGDRCDAPLRGRRRRETEKRSSHRS